MSPAQKSALEAELKRRWPDQSDPKTHSLAFGFSLGAGWGFDEPGGNLRAELAIRFPFNPDAERAALSAIWSAGFELGALWSQKLGEPGKPVAHIFAVSAPWISGEDPLEAFSGVVLSIYPNLQDALDSLPFWKTTYAKAPGMPIVVSRPRPQNDLWIPVVAHGAPEGSLDFTEESAA